MQHRRVSFKIFWILPWKSLTTFLWRQPKFTQKAFKYEPNIHRIWSGLFIDFHFYRRLSKGDCLRIFCSQHYRFFLWNHRCLSIFLVRLTTTYLSKRIQQCLVDLSTIIQHWWRLVALPWRRLGLSSKHWILHRWPRQCRPGFPFAPKSWSPECKSHRGTPGNTWPIGRWSPTASRSRRCTCATGTSAGTPTWRPRWWANPGPSRRGPPRGRPRAEADMSARLSRQNARKRRRFPREIK